MKKHYYFAKILTKLLDTQFSIGKFRFGIDPLLDFIPGIGDILALLLSLYIIWVAKEMKVPKNVIFQMVKNVTVDFVLGLIPLVGYVADFFYKANVSNLKLLEKYAKKRVIEGEIISEK